MNTFARIATLGILFLLIGACLSAGQKVGDPLPPGPPSDLPAAGLQRLDAGINLKYDQTQRNRYRTLLKTIESPGDRGVYGDFCDYGYWQGYAYAGQTDLPPGYWVYLAPNWYIFKDNATSSTPPPPLAPRSWGPEQAVGAPDTWPKSGDIGTAWASKTPDGQEEWLQLTYAAPVHPTAVLVYETYNPGALSRITCVAEDGKETDLWTGSDPTAPGSTKGISVVPLHPQADLKCIRLYLDSPKVAGWNEIDAVGLVDEAGQTHWASSATASSTYADNTAPAQPQIPVIFDRLSDR